MRSPSSKTSTWDITMSTNEAAGEFWATTLKEMHGVPLGLPDPAVLTRMANEFFNAVGNVESVKDASPPAVTTLSVEALPAPIIPSLPATVPAAGVPAFSFLKEVRPLSYLPGAKPALPEIDAPPAAASPFALPLGQFDLKELLDLKELHGAALPLRAPETFQPPMPTLPGAFGAFDSSAFQTFSFLEDARPLYSYPPAAPGAAPAQAEASLPNSSSGAFDAAVIRRDFPILRERVNGRPLVWLDNAATTQKPQSVIDRLAYFYEHENSNVHRAAHELAARATDAHEAAAEKVRRFLNAASVKEIVFVRGATEAINLVAQSWGRQFIGKAEETALPC